MSLGVQKWELRLKALFREDHSGASIYFIGIKGSGMCALAQLLRHLGYRVSGSDVDEPFYTDALLTASGIDYFRGFSAANLPPECDLIIYSAAYGPGNPEYAAAQHRSGELPVLSYPEAVGALARFGYGTCIAVCGTHGKTTSTLLGSGLMQSLGMKGSALAGAGAAHLGGNAYLAQGREFLLVEACEYRNHFFAFAPKIALLTSLEWDHQDFFTSYAMLEQSFCRFLSQGSLHTLVYCADDPAVVELVGKLPAELRLIPYGLQAEADFGLLSIESAVGQTVLRLRDAHSLVLKMPGKHLTLNALGALAALFAFISLEAKTAHTKQIAKEITNKTAKRIPTSSNFEAAPKTLVPFNFRGFLAREYPKIQAGLDAFRGASRRSELLGELPWPAWQHSKPALHPDGKSEKKTEAGSVLVLDDYAHHPTAVQKTLSGLKSFYPDRRLVLDFMPHTYSRSESLHDAFSRCFAAAHVLILHDIYSSAREKAEDQHYSTRILLKAVNEQRRKLGQEAALFFSQPLDALPELHKILKPGDLFVTMGAGNNRELALALLGK